MQIHIDISLCQEIAHTRWQIELNCAIMEPMASERPTKEVVSDEEGVQDEDAFNKEDNEDEPCVHALFPNLQQSLKMMDPSDEHGGTCPPVASRFLFPIGPFWGIFTQKRHISNDQISTAIWSF